MLLTIGVTSRSHSLVRQVTRKRRESEEIIVHDSHGHEQHKTVEEALEEVMVESKRTQKHSMMGMFGLNPNKLDFDYEKHFPEHDFLQVYDDDYHPPGANRRPRPSQTSLLLKWSQDKMAQVRKEQLSKRHSIA